MGAGECSPLNTIGITLRVKQDEPATRAASSAPLRRLRGYAFDPSLSNQLDTAAINQAIFETPWEPCSPAPSGSTLEVLDYDPAGAMWYEPVHLDGVELLAQDGLAPSEGNPQFHQQMVYAAAMNTIANFEYALRRQNLLVSEVRSIRPLGQAGDVRATVAPLPARAARRNAYYSPSKCGILLRLLSRPDGHRLRVPLARHRRARDDATPCWTACTAATSRTITRIRWRFTRPLRISWRSSNTSRFVTCCATRSPGRAGIGEPVPAGRARAGVWRCHRVDRSRAAG